MKKDCWLSYIAQQGLSIADLALEITEGMILGDNRDVRAQLNAFRAAGI
ncbi:hypothetical protein [Reinekea sp.]|jgi:EAL domain-containing protein (putative c-di-GMP-specific phosphodiesterase class I)|nr:hypothetical protein [Reinekea sp.]